MCGPWLVGNVFVLIHLSFHSWFHFQWSVLLNERTVVRQTLPRKTSPAVSTMEAGPCSISLQERRVLLVESWSQNVTLLQQRLYQIGALTEEDLSLIKGGGWLGERDCMRTLLDVLYGRGEEACRAFFHILRSVEADTESRVAACLPEDLEPGGSGSGLVDIQEHLRRHKDILSRHNSPVDYLSVGTRRRSGSEDGDGAGSFTDITLSRRVGYTVPLQSHQHEAATVGDAFRGQDQVCTFKDLCQTVLSVPGEDLTVLSGVAGSGKTTVVRRLVHEWARDSDSQKIVLSLSFRELNLLSEPQSLQELLLIHYSHLKPVLAWVVDSQPGRVLLILDGLDEFRFPLDFERSPKCSDPGRQLGLGEMVVNLIKGHLMPGISILVTSRPHAISKIPPLLVNRLYSVLGFSTEQQRHYFEQSCHSAPAASVVWEFVSSYQPLQLMCRIPAFCWIVSTALCDGFASCLGQVPATTSGPLSGVAAPAGPSDPAVSDGAEVAPTASTFSSATVPRVMLMNGHIKSVTITEIYCCFLKSVLVFHGEGRSQEACSPHRLQETPRLLQEQQPLLRDLGAMAFKGLLERRFIFDQADLTSFSLDCSGLSKAFLVETLREDRASLTYQRSFHFIHTSVQEFLAALFYVLEALSGSDPFSGAKKAVGVAMFPVSLHILLSSTANKLLRPRWLLRRYIKKAFSWGGHHQSGHMDLFCRFVSGLLVPQTQFVLNGLFQGRSQKRHPQRSPSVSLPSPPPSTPPFLLDLLHSQLQSGRLSPERQVNLCHCLYEAMDPGLTQRLQGWLQVLSQQQVPDQSDPAKRDWSELTFLLQLIPDLQDLNLEAQGLDAEGLRRLLPVLPLFSTLRLGQNPLGPEGAAVLVCAMQSPDCRVERLWVVATELGCEGCRVLAEGLKDNKTVVDLRMAINHIGDVGVGCLADLLQTNRTLKDIRLRDNQVTDKGAEILMKALNENTTLEQLWLFDNKFSKEGVKRLKEFAKGRSQLDIKVCV
ncbi:NLR family CARD domain-containing protein 3 [Esox lucius]|uniref:NLR family CARD domain-containing protein 3 n=1 Tax=Esox lucius TaxID=8010 RepID=UPI0005780760|nr:NLR family CARD domain-containing protein 3 [Esox lucius]